MREIKFRAWDVEGNQYWDDSVEDWKIEYQNGKLTLFIWSLKWNVTNPDDSNEGYQSGSWEEVENVVFQEFTGIHDKNNVEVYESDIIEDDLEYLAVVKFGEHLTSTDYYASTTYGWYAERVNGDTHSLAQCGTITVRGNIHEHPHLLERSVEG